MTVISGIPFELNITINLLNCYTWHCQRCLLSVNNNKKKSYTTETLSINVHGYWFYIYFQFLFLPFRFQKLSDITRGKSQGRLKKYLALCYIKGGTIYTLNQIKKAFFYNFFQIFFGKIELITQHLYKD